MSKNADTSIYELADYMMMTMPYPRTAHYSQDDFFKIQRAVTGYANQIIDDVGFYPLRADLDVLSQMETYSTAMLFLGLIFDIILLLFTSLSILLFYSLLMISVETKTFEFGVMRMVGLSKTGIINVVFVQAFMYVMPSMVIAFITSVPALFFLFKFIFTGDSIEPQSPFPSDVAIAQAVLVGILIPFFSSILPIKVALSKDLNESLDTSRSKTKANMVEVLDPNNAN